MSTEARGAMVKRASPLRSGTAAGDGGGSASWARSSSSRQPFFSHEATELAPCRADFEAHAFPLLQIGHDLEQVSCLWIALGTEHAHQALGRPTRNRAECFETDRRVDVVAQHGLAGLDVAGEKALDPFTQELLAEGGIAPYARLDRLLEVPRQCHIHVPSFFRRL